MKTARQVAAEALAKMEREDGWSSAVLDSALERSGLPSRDKAFCSALFYGVVARRYTLDACLSVYSKTPVPKLDERVRSLLRCGFYQLLWMDGVPDRAAVNETVNLARVMGRTSAAGLVNAVMRAFLRDGKKLPAAKTPLEQLAIDCSCPPEMARLLLFDWGEDTARNILTAGLETPPAFARVNELKISPEALIASLEKEGLSALADPVLPGCLRLEGNPSGTAAFREGLFFLQDRSSQLCAHTVGARPGDAVLDCCAAPGGKSFSMAIAMENRGRLVSCDLHGHRADRMTERSHSLGISILEPHTLDMAEPHPELGLFDRVLCDVPCSGLGTLRRRPEIKYKDPERFRELPELQYRILCEAAKYCKEGGLLVYSTCTLFSAENGMLTSRFLAEHPDFSLPDGNRERTILPGEDGGDGFYLSAFTRIR